MTDQKIQSNIPALSGEKKRPNPEVATHSDKILLNPVTKVTTSSSTHSKLSQSKSSQMKPTSSSAANLQKTLPFSLSSTALPVAAHSATGNSQMNATVVKPESEKHTLEKQALEHIRSMRIELVESMLSLIHREVKRVGFYEDKADEDVHPLYKFVFQEAVKKVFQLDCQDTPDQSPLPILGLDQLKMNEL